MRSNVAVVPLRPMPESVLPAGPPGFSSEREMQEMVLQLTQEKLELIEYAEALERIFQRQDTVTTYDAAVRAPMLSKMLRTYEDQIAALEAESQALKEENTTLHSELTVAKKDNAVMRQEASEKVVEMEAMDWPAVKGLLQEVQQGREELDLRQRSLKELRLRAEVLERDLAMARTDLRVSKQELDVTLQAHQREVIRFREHLHLARQERDVAHQKVRQVVIQHESFHRPLPDGDSRWTDLTINELDETMAQESARELLHELKLCREAADASSNAAREAEQRLEEANKLESSRLEALANVEETLVEKEEQLLASRADARAESETACRCREELRTQRSREYPSGDRWFSRLGSRWSRSTSSLRFPDSPRSRCWSAEQQLGRASFETRDAVAYAERLEAELQKERSRARYSGDPLREVATVRGSAPRWLRDGQNTSPHRFVASTSRSPSPRWHLSPRLEMSERREAELNVEEQLLESERKKNDLAGQLMACERQLATMAEKLSESDWREAQLQAWAESCQGQQEVGSLQTQLALTRSRLAAKEQSEVELRHLSEVGMSELASLRAVVHENWQHEVDLVARVEVCEREMTGAQVELRAAAAASEKQAAVAGEELDLERQHTLELREAVDDEQRKAEAERHGLERQLQNLTRYFLGQGGSPRSSGMRALPLVAGEVNAP